MGQIFVVVEGAGAVTRRRKWRKVLVGASAAGDRCCKEVEVLSHGFFTDSTTQFFWCAPAFTYHINRPVITPLISSFSATLYTGIALSFAQLCIRACTRDC